MPDEVTKLNKLKSVHKLESTIFLFRALWQVTKDININK